MTAGTPRRQAFCGGFMLTQFLSFFLSIAFIMPKGTPIKIHSLAPISSETVGLGETVRFEVAEDVKIDGVVVVPKGSEAEGFVVAAMPAKRWGAARLSVYISSVHTRTGFRVPVHVVADAPRQLTKEAFITPDMEFIAETTLDLSLDKDSYVPAT